MKIPRGSYLKLQQAELPLVFNAECLAKITALPVAGRLNVTQQMVCAGDLNPADMKGGCHGDSGGPFVWKDSTSGKFVLEGSVSRGSSNCYFVQQSKQYTVFPRVSEFRDWIDQQIAINKSNRTIVRLFIGIWQIHCIDPF